MSSTSNVYELSSCYFVMVSVGSGDLLAKLTCSKIACWIVLINFVHMITLAIASLYNPESSYLVNRSALVVSSKSSEENNSILVICVRIANMIE